MKIDTTKNRVHFIYSFKGVTDEEYCFELEDDFALTLLHDLPWCDYLIQFPIDYLRPLQVGDMVSVIYKHTHNPDPRNRWMPVDWYAI